MKRAGCWVSGKPVAGAKKRKTVTRLICYDLNEIFLMIPSSRFMNIKTKLFPTPRTQV